MQKTIVRRQSKPIKDEFPSSFHPVLKRIYLARNVNNLMSLEKELKDLIPFQSLKNIDKAVACLEKALLEEKRIIIIGDFDADGATSSVLAVSALKSFGAKEVDYLVPNRFEFGYGLTKEIVEVAAKRKPDLIITVDNGISSIEGVDLANELGMEVIITDHHLPGRELPKAVAIINPNQVGDEFASKNLAGVGVIFYVMLALRSHLRETDWFQKKNISEPNMAQFLDLVALGTVADVVPLDKNNRILVHQGLLRIRAKKCRPGFHALIDIARRNQIQLSASDLGFALAPRLNAAGRLDDMSLGIACLLADSLAEAMPLAEELDQLNKERRSIEAGMQAEALQYVKVDEEKELPFGLCLYDENWHQGVIGILAGRIKERYHRPVIAFAPVNDTDMKGSARSISGLHIRDLLDRIATQNPGLIDKFGGHAMAAGLSIRKKDFKAFYEAFDTAVREQVDASLLEAVIYTDGELEPSNCNLDFAETLHAAGPWGQAFPEPLFDNDFILLEQRIVGERHLKMTLQHPDSETIISAIAFNVDLQEWPNHRARNIHAAYRLDINEYQGLRTVQLIIESLYPVSPSL